MLAVGGRERAVQRRLAAHLCEPPVVCGLSARLRQLGVAFGEQAIAHLGELIALARSNVAGVGLGIALGCEALPGQKLELTPRAVADVPAEPIKGRFGLALGLRSHSATVTRFDWSRARKALGPQTCTDFAAIPTRATG